MGTALGKLESEFFAHIQARQLRCVENGQLTEALGLSPVQERKLLSRLASRGLIARVRRGLYLVPPRLPVGGRWSPGEALALRTLIEDRNGRYQICGPNAFHRYGWDDQVPIRIYAYNNRISGERTIGTMAFTLIKVTDDRLGATEVVKTPDGVDLVYSSRVRSLVDAVCDWSRFNGLPRAYDWIRTELADDDSVAANLVNVSLDYGNQGTLRRIGKLLELEGVQNSLLRKIEKAIRRSTSLIPWIPKRPKRGTVDRRWGVVVNDG